MDQAIYFVENSLPFKNFTVFLASVEDSIAGDCGIPSLEVGDGQLQVQYQLTFLSQILFLNKIKLNYTKPKEQQQINNNINKTQPTKQEII